jgi:hypothetical protein
MPATKKAAAIHAVIGTDDVEVKRVAKEISAQLGAGGDFGADIIDGHADNADGAAQRIYNTIEALNTFAFFGWREARVAEECELLWRRPHQQRRGHDRGAGKN